MDPKSITPSQPARRPPVRRAPAAGRVLGALVGLGALACGAAVSFGVGLVAALIGMGLATAFRRWRGHRYTSLTGWLGATLGVAAAIVAFMVVMLVRAPSGSLESLRQQAISQQEQRPQQVPEWLRRYMPQTQPPRSVTAATNRFTESRPVFWWMAAMTVVLAALMLGACVGTIAWGGATMLMYGIAGRWPAAARPADQTGTG